MVALEVGKLIAATSIAFSFVLAGNAVTQSYMTIPALLVDFPDPSSSKHSEAATHLGRQWPLCWNVGNNLFRPISTLGFLGYAYTSWSMSQSGYGDWRLLAVSAVLHFSNILHSAVNMQPINDKLTALAGTSSDGKERTATSDQSQAEALARKWANGNKLRLVCPLIAGTLAMSQVII